MKQKLFLTIFIIIMVFGLLGHGADKARKLPKVGSIYILDKAEFYVRGVGNKPFSYVATGESLAIKILKVSGTMVFVPKKGEKVRVDPTIPMIWIGKKEKREFRTNSYLKKHGKNAIFLLLEYKR
jgi:hypothetical protein